MLFGCLGVKCMLQGFGAAVHVTCASDQLRVTSLVHFHRIIAPPSNACSVPNRLAP